MKIDYNKHIWEGWTIQDFIDGLSIEFDILVSNSKNFGQLAFNNKEELKKWCMDNQPYYKKHIPEVVEHFANILNLK